MGEDNKSLEIVYKEYLKEYCGQLPNISSDNRIYPVSLEKLYTPLRIRKGKMAGNDSFGFDSKEPLDLHDIDEVIKHLNQQLDERLMGIAHEDQAEGKSDLNFGKIKIVYARPGGGKTTWSKRVCLACLENDEEFFSEQLPLNNWHMEGGLFPLLLCCRNMTEINNASVNEFLSLAREMTALSFGKNIFQNYSKQDFYDLLCKHAQDGSLLLIVDGWDELANEEREKHLESILNWFLEKNPKVKCVITTRGQQKTTKILNIGDAYTIETLNSEEVQLFCKRWHEEMFRGDLQRIENYGKVIKQLESPFFSRISYMTETPYLLANLLRCSQHYGRLPSSIAELYEKITDMMVEWFTKIDTGLEKHDIMIQLAYIAYAMTKNRKLTISKSELCELLGRCFFDLDGLFRRPLRDITVEQYLTQFLSRNCVLETNIGGLYHFPHREMQDYYSAVAIVNGYLDSEDIMRDPYDILKRHYTSLQQSERMFWETIVVFSTLISGPRFARAVVGDIIKLAEKDTDNEFGFRDLLFLFVLNDTDILKSERLQIYEVCFARQISTNQISGIWQLAEQNDVDYAEFTRFIKSEFVKSIDNGDLLYSFAWAIISAKQNADDGVNPLHKAEQLLLEGNEFDFLTGLAVLDVLSWCKYEMISGNEFTKYYHEEGFEISSDGCKALQCALVEKTIRGSNPFSVDIARTIHSCALAEYLDASRIKEIIPNDFLLALQHRESLSKSSREVLNYLLAVYPVPTLESIPISPRIGIEQTRAYYLHQFDSDWKSNRCDSLAFSFNRCLVVGVWKTEDEVKEQLVKFKAIRLDTPNRARLTQIKKMLAFFSICFDEEGVSRYEFYVQRDKLSDNNDQYIEWLSEIEDITDKTLPEELRISILNNLAYLVRRDELKCVRVDGNGRCLAKAEELLEQGVGKKEGFSLINYSLAISGFNKNCTGSYEVGLDYLQKCFSPPAEILREIKLWWWRLAKEKSELEGAIVLMWLYELGYIDLVEEATNEKELSLDSAEFLAFHFREKAEKLGNHCNNTLMLLEKFTKQRHVK